MTSEAPTPLDVALRLLECGISVLPLKLDGSKAPDVSTWAPWSTAEDAVRMTPDAARRLFHSQAGIGIIAGPISGNLEIVDAEGHAPLSELQALIEEHAPGLFERLVRVLTPRGGWHLFYYCSTVEGNQKLAMTLVDGKPKTMIETRGTGGYVATISSPPEIHELHRPYTLLHGRLTQIPTITPEEREILHTCCRSFNSYVKPEHVHRPSTPSPAGAGRPGDDYNARGNPLDVLLKYDWTVAHRSGDTLYLKRPGKTGPGISASLHHVASNVLYVFSSNASPFDFDRGYDAFGVYSILEFGGDVAAAARALGKAGYGSPAAKPNGHTLSTAAPNSPPGLPAVVEPAVLLESGQSLQTLAQLTDPTEDAVARLFEEAYKDQFRYVKPWGTWLNWDVQRWKMEKTALAFDHSRKLARMVNLTGSKSIAKASFARGVESFAQASRTFATETTQWDRDEFLLATEGGTVDLLNNTIRPPLQADYITKMCRVAPSSAPKPLFDRFMRDICLEDEALIHYHQRALGSILSGARADHWILFWIGTGRNGKNTLGDLVAWILGDYARVIPSETLMSVKTARHPTDLATLRGLRLAMSSEVEEGSYWNEARIKSLTGDEQISARFIAQDFFEFPRTHKHLVFGNNRPMLRVVDEAMKARLHVVPFKADFTKAADPDMPRKLRTEGSPILQWLIDGHEMWREDGGLKKCSAVQAETDYYFESQSTPEMWVSEMCLITDPDCRSTPSELYASFNKWKESRGEKPMSQTRWGEWMSIRYRKIKTHGSLVYEGIRLNPYSITVNSSEQTEDRDR